MSLKREKGSFELMKKLNISIILRIIRERGPISRAEIAEISDLTPASVTKITQRLLESNLIIDVGAGVSSGGRPPVYLKLNPLALYVVGICFAPCKIDVIITDFEAGIIASQRKAVGHLAPEEAFTVAQQLLDQMIREHILQRERIIGVGVAMNGIVNSKQGISLFAPYYKWENIPVKKKLEERLQLPVFVENDVNAMALAERWFGLLKDYTPQSIADDNFVVINIEDGVGAGIVMHDRIYHGCNYAAGEIGHIVVDERGAICTCGKRGCLESMVSTPAIEKKVIRLLEEGEQSSLQELAEHTAVTINTICEAALAGDRLACEVIKQAGEHIGFAVANLMAVLNPSKVIIAGCISKAGNVFLNAVSSMIEKETLALLSSCIEIKGSSLGEFRASKGGVVLVLMELFKGEILTL